MKKTITRLLATALSAALLVGCGAAEEAGRAEESSVPAATENGETVIRVGYPTSAYPLAYETEDGELTGYEIEVLKLVDERLDSISFTYDTATQDALYAGLNAEKYDLLITNSFYTDERAETYVLPENPIGASVVGIILPKERTGVETFQDVADQGLKLAPILAGDGLYFVVYQYNQQNPEHPIELTATDDPNSFMDAVGWIAEGRYDVAVWPKNYYESVVSAEDGDLHQYNDSLQFIENRSVNTYTILRKGEEEIAAQISEVLGQLKEEGKLQELSVQFYGYDAFKYESEN